MIPSTESVRRGRRARLWAAACLLAAVAALLGRSAAPAAATPASRAPACCTIGAGHPAIPTSDSQPLEAAITEAECTGDEIDPRESSSHSWPLRCTARTAASEADDAVAARCVAGHHISKLAATSLSRLCRRLL